MMQAVLSEIPPSDWIYMSRHEASLKGYFPNKVAWPRDPDDKKVVIEITRAERGDFAINWKALEKAAKLSGVQAYVVLKEKDGEFVNQTTAKLLYAKLKSEKLSYGTYGPYHWVNGNFELAELISNSPM